MYKRQIKESPEYLEFQKQSDILKKKPELKERVEDVYKRQAHIRSMDQKELDSCTSTARQKCSL